eukprot:scaffold1181_cov387-Prasinococcus_capsulatus_cf.AAC.6
MGTTAALCPSPPPPPPARHRQRRDDRPRRPRAAPAAACAVHLPPILSLARLAGRACCSRPCAEPLGST